MLHLSLEVFFWFRHWSQCLIIINSVSNFVQKVPLKLPFVLVNTFLGAPPLYLSLLPVLRVVLIYQYTSDRLIMTHLI